MGIVPPSLKHEIRRKFNTIRKELFRTVYIFTPPEKADCPNCISNYTGASIGLVDSSFVTPVTIFDTLISPINFTRGRCPVCEGVGFLEGSSKTGIKALVRWNPTGTDSKGNLVMTVAGKEGYNVIQLKTDKYYYEILRDATKAEIDGVTCEVLLPAVYRNVGDVEVSVIAYFMSTSVGHNTRD